MPPTATSSRPNHETIIILRCKLCGEEYEKDPILLGSFCVECIDYRNSIINEEEDTDENDESA